MSLGQEWRRLGRASEDPTVTLLLLLPLGLLHLSAAGVAPNAALGVVQRLVLQPLGPARPWVLGSLLGLALLWTLGRIRRLELAWRGGLALRLAEGILAGVLLAPALRFLTALLPLERAPLVTAALPSGLHARLALAAGAGLYEELLFRGLLLGGLAVLLRGGLAGLGLREPARPFAPGLALFLSSACFALAHAAGDPGALAGPVLAYRFLAGMVLGLLFLLRGLAVAAWAHFTYDALLLLGS